MIRAPLLLPLALLMGCPPGPGPGPATGGGTAGAGGGLPASTGGGAVTGGGGAGGLSGGGTGGSGGGSSGGGASGGSAGGAATTGGVFTVADSVFDPKVVAGADGVFHLTHRTQTPDTIVYGRCAANCGAPSGWAFTAVEANRGFLADARIAVGADGRVHLVYSASGPSRNIYATCAANCTAGSASWTKVDLVTPSDCDSENHQTNLVLDAQGRLTFMSSDSNSEKLCVNTCAGACSTAANWQSGVVVNIRVVDRRIDHALAGHGTTLHLVYDDLTAGLRYASCAANCTQTASWQFSNPLFFHRDTPIALTATSSGRVVLAYNQGTTDATAPMDVKAFDGRLLAWECDGACGDRANWRGLVIGDPDDGKNGLSAWAQGSNALVVSAEVTGATAFEATGRFDVPASWASADLETTATLAAALPDPYTVLGCTMNGMPVRPAHAMWSSEHPSVAVSATGLVVHSATRGQRTCPGLTTAARFPGYGRVLFSPP